MTDAEKAAKYDKLWTLYEKTNRRLTEAYKENERLCQEAEVELAKLRDSYVSTTRDRFAKAALTGVMCNPANNDLPAKGLAATALDVADAMLEMRER
jgi:hypothetical protein